MLARTRNTYVGKIFTYSRDSLCIHVFSFYSTEERCERGRMHCMLGAVRKRLEEPGAQGYGLPEEHNFAPPTHPPPPSKKIPNTILLVLTSSQSKFHLTLKMTSAQVVETSVKVTSNSPSQDYTHPDDHNLLTYDMTPGFKRGFKPFAKFLTCGKALGTTVVENREMRFCHAMSHNPHSSTYDGRRKKAQTVSKRAS